MLLERACRGTTNSRQASFQTVETGRQRTRPTLCAGAGYQDADYPIEQVKIRKQDTIPCREHATPTPYSSPLESPKLDPTQYYHLFRVVFSGLI